MRLMVSHHSSSPVHALPWWKLPRLFDWRPARRRRFDAVCITLERDRPVCFVCPADVRVRCLAGTAWITTEGDTRDVVLEAGQVHPASRGHRLFVNGLPRCTLRIE
jgi:hypothetical protein